MVISPRIRRCSTQLAWVVLWVASTLLVALQLGRPLYYTDGRDEVPASALVAAGMVAYGTPEVRCELPGPVQGRVAVLPDGRLVYGRSTAALGAELVLFDPTRPTAPPEPLHALNSPHHELAPAFGADGRLYFASDRPGGAGGYDLYAARWLGTGFGPVEALVPANTALDECDPAPAPDGARLVFVRCEPARGIGAPGVLWQCDLAAGRAPVPLWSWRTSRESAAVDRDPVFSADGSALWFVRQLAEAPPTVHRASCCGAEFDAPRALGREWGTLALRSPLPLPGLALGLLWPGSAPDAAALWYQAQGRELPPWWPGQRWLTWLLLGCIGFAALLLVLLHYGQRWRALDLLAQCLLLSLLLHVLLALWLWGVELANAPLPGRDPPGGLEVRLVGTVSGASGTDAAAAGAVAAAFAVAQYTPSERTLVAEAPGTGLLSGAGEASAVPAVWQPLAHEAVAGRVPEVRVAQVAELAPQFTGEDAPTALAAPTVAPPAAPASALARVAPSAAGSEAPLEVAVPAPALGALQPGAVPSERAAAHLPAGVAPTLPVAARAVRAPVVQSRVPEAGAPEWSGAAPELADAQPAAANAPTAPEWALAPASAAAQVAVAAATVPAAQPQAGTPPLASPPAAALDPARVAVPAPAAPAASPPPAALAVPSRRHAPPPLALRGAAPVLEAAVGEPAAGDPAAGSPAAAAVPAAPTLADRTAGPATAPPAAVGWAGAATTAPEPMPPPSSALRRPAASAAVARVGAAPPVGLPHERAVRAPSPTLRAAADGTAAVAAVRPVEATNPVERGRLAPAAPGLAGPVAATARSAPPSGAHEPLPALRLPGSGLRRVAVALTAPATAPAVTAVAATPYSNRFGPAKTKALEQFGGTDATERAVAGGLAYLARIQNRDGTWGDPQHFDDKYGLLFVGKTALCTLAFLGAGHTPTSASEHSQVVARALAALLRQQDARTGAFGASSCYGHGIATYALAECHALTRDPALRAPLEAALRWIVQNQGPRRDLKNRGGWGYFAPGLAREDDFARVSVTAWMVMALESARLSGVAVPDPVLPRAREYLEQSFDAPNGWFRYNQKPSRLASAWPTLPASTPAGAFCLLLLGAPRDDAKVRAALDYTVARAPIGYRRFDDDTFVLRGQGNVYFWYYGSLCAFLAGGAHWTAWNERLRTVLPPAQAPDGSFPPIDAYAQEAGDDEQDRSYTTAMCVLCLQVYYRYFTPLLLGR
ncbi:MAG: PD40 domain-containing protein [Planctomycetes bacterium]|nr:PD40 domain-containing protein [Planctomycetota bacterium]